MNASTVSPVVSPVVSPTPASQSQKASRKASRKASQSQPASQPADASQKASQSQPEGQKASQPADASQKASQSQPEGQKASQPADASHAMTTYSGQSNIKMVSSLSDVQKLAKSLAKTLAPVELSKDAERWGFWNRVNTFGDALQTVATPEMRKALVSLVNAELAIEGKTGIKNQDFRHWACAYNLKKQWPSINWVQYGENKLEATALKWFKGSYSDLLENGTTCFTRRDDVVKLPDGTNANCNKLIDNLESSLAIYASETPRQKTKLSASEKIDKKAKSLAMAFIKEYAKEKGNFGGLLRSFLLAIRSNNDDGKINTLAILDTLSTDALEAFSFRGAYSNE